MKAAKDINQILEINRENIKYFKKKKVFVQESAQPGFYTDRDVENLQRLVVLRKAGMTCDDIKKVQNGEVTLAKAISERSQILEEKMDQIRGALRLSEEMLQCHVQYDSLDTKTYWMNILQRERDGEKFMDIDEEVWKIDFVRDVKCPYCGFEQEIDLEDYLVDTSSFEKEHGMGPDMVYTIDSEGNHVCPICGKLFRISGWIREYPIGAYDSDEVSTARMERDDDYQ